MEEQGDDGIFGDRTSQRGEDHTSQRAHWNNTAYVNDDQWRSYQTASKYKKNKERSARYDKRGSRKGSTPYDDDEDPFVDAATNVDNKSSDLPSQNHYKEELDDAFAQEGHHDTRASRKPRSPNNAKSAQYAGRLPMWGQLPMTTTTTTTPTPVKFAYSELSDMLNRGGARLSTRTKISSELKWQPKNGKDKEKNKKFLKSILQVRGFNVFLFMTKDSTIVKMAHSAAKFATINPMADNVDGKNIRIYWQQTQKSGTTSNFNPNERMFNMVIPQSGQRWKNNVGPLQGQKKLWGPLSENRGKSIKASPEHSSHPTRRRKAIWVAQERKIATWVSQPIAKPHQGP
jgi:hypothetical protein